tara:strand:- start:5062 stop:5418 length:357 start_codon:yes stop_codon:yes gene_type:complete
MENTSTKQTETNQAADSSLSIATIAYITFIGLIIAYVMNKDKKEAFANYHIRQSLGLALTGLAIGIISLIPILGWIIYIVGFVVLIYMWVLGLMNAINKKEQPVPFLGEKFNEWFKNV